jgi:hypothetical protein
MTIDEAISTLRNRGHVVGDIYVQELGESCAQMHVVIDGRAVTFPQAIAMAQGDAAVSRKRGRRKFQPGDKFRGRSEGVKAWIREQTGVVLSYHEPSQEYHVRLDNGEIAYVAANWIGHV